MKKLWNRFKGMKRQEKVMLVFIILLIVCIISRWSFIKDEAGEAIRHRLRTSPAFAEPDSSAPDTAYIQ